MVKQSWVKEPAGKILCVIATTCGIKGWETENGLNALVENYGYVKGKKAAKRKLPDIKELAKAEGVFTSANRKDYTHKYVAKRIVHETKIQTYRFAYEGAYGQLILSYDLQFKKGKLAKKVPVGLIFQSQEINLNRIHKNKGKVLKNQVRRLSKVAIKTQLSGPIPNVRPTNDN